MTTQTSDQSDGDFGSENGQGGLPFGALPESADSDGGTAKSASTTSRKKAVRKKAVKKAVSKKVATKKVATKKTATKKAASKKAVKKPSLADDAGSDGDGTDAVPAPRKKATTKKKATRKKASAAGSASGPDSGPDPASTDAATSPASGVEAPVKKTVRKKKVSPLKASAAVSTSGSTSGSSSSPDSPSGSSSVKDSGASDEVGFAPRDADRSKGSQRDDSPRSRTSRDDPPRDVSPRDDSPRGDDSPRQEGGGSERQDRDYDDRGPKRKRTRRSRRRRRSEEDDRPGDRSGDRPDERDSRDGARSGPERVNTERANAEGSSLERSDASDGVAARNGSGGHNSERGERSDRPDEEGRGDRPRRRRRRRGRKGRPEDGGDDKAPGGSQGGQHGGGQGGHGGGSGERTQERKAAYSKPKKEGKVFRKDGGPKYGDRGPKEDRRIDEVEGMFFLEKGQVSVLRHLKNQWLSSKEDIYVPKKLVQQFKLHDGMIVKGPASRGFKHKVQLDSVVDIDGHPPEYWKKKPFFKNLTSIDPDFHYAVGDITDEVSMRVLDLIAPIGRGQRGLLVAPPRTGKTTLMRQFAAGIEKGYPDVHLMILLIDERPEEATEWKRSVDRGEVFVSTADETAKNHINLAEVVWRRANRLVEMGEDVVLLMDSITRLARAYNNQSGEGSGRTMSGGLDSRAMERPRKFFGSARNTVEAGSLTILGTTLIETGSRMDQLVFEEFKGTGNMELVLNRKLADRRIFPAIDIEKSGTRKEEKLVGLRRLKLIHVLRRVLARMHFAEAADLLITKLSEVEKTDDFLAGFTIDRDA